jgi:hypothetical protein
MTMRAFHPLALALAIPVIASAQSHPRPKGILTCNWGASRWDVISTLRQQGATLPEEDPGGDRLVGTGGTFAGQQVVTWTMEFLTGKLIAGSVTLKPAESGSVLYRDLKQQLISKYGPHSGEGKMTGARDERRARAASGLPTPKRGTAVTWKFPPTLQDKDSLSITCELAPPADLATEDESLFVVTLRYANETMKAQAAKMAANPTPEPAAPAKSSRAVKGECL